MFKKPRFGGAFLWAAGWWALPRCALDRLPRVVTSPRAGSAAHLPVGEAVPAGALAARLGITRPTLARLVAEARDRVVRLGRTRATAYAVRQPTAAGSEWPLFRLRADATTPHW